MVMLGNNHKAPLTRAAPPWLIKLVAHSGPYSLNQQPHGLAPNRNIPLDAQNILFACKADNRLSQCLGVINLGQGYDRAIEFLMFVLILTIMVRGTSGQIIFRRCVQAQNNGGVNRTITAGQNGQGARRFGQNHCTRVFQRCLIPKVGLGQQSELRAG